MAAYVISEVRFLDPDAVERYRTLAAESIAEYGGRYLVRAATPYAAEGDWPANVRLVIVEFDDMDTARRWYASESYARALAHRDEALTRRLTFVDGT